MDDLSKQLDEMRKVLLKQQKQIEQTNELLHLMVKQVRPKSKKEVRAISSQVVLSDIPDEALIREGKLISVLPFSRVTLWRRVKAGEFPQPIYLGARTKCWRWGEVREWLSNQSE